MTIQGNIPAPDGPGAGDTERVGVAVYEAARSSRVPGWFVILWRNGKCRLGLVMLAAFILVALLAPVIAPYGPHVDDFPTSEGPSAAHWLGTTARGEDVFSQLVYGARTSLVVGLVAGFLVHPDRAGDRSHRRLPAGHGGRGAVVLHQPRPRRAGAAADDRAQPRTRR